MKKYYIENTKTGETFEYTEPIVIGSNVYVLDICGNLMQVSAQFDYGQFEYMECTTTNDYTVTVIDKKQSPEEFVNSNYFHLTLDCKRDINDIQEAIKKYSEL